MQHLVGFPVGGRALGAEPHQLQRLSEHALQTFCTSPLPAGWRSQSNAGFLDRQRERPIEHLRRSPGVMARLFPGSGHDPLCIGCVEYGRKT